jgi:DNA-binding NtrC family response regulator
LRERREDIQPLAVRFLEEFSRGRSRLSAAVVPLLERYGWPGNVRELRNAMERAALLSRGELVLPDHLPARVRGGGETVTATVPIDAGRLDDMERQAILQTLKRCDYNRSEAARVLGISRRALLYKLQRLRELGCDVDGLTGAG